MVGAQIAGFETMVSLSEDAPIAIFEGDEYLSSTLDPRPKFHLYKPHIALISGIAWDHINVFPTFENYKEQFSIFIDKIENNGCLFYYKNDEVLKDVVKNSNKSIQRTGYVTHAYTKRNNITYLIDLDKEIPLQIFGEHNLQNISGAKLVCNELGISDDEFYDAIAKFKGAAKRLEILTKNENTIIFRDFAHSPSKLKATVNAVSEQFVDRKLVAVMELHTFSSLNSAFLNEYQGSMDAADTAVVYFNPEVIKHKRLEPISEQQVKLAFNNSRIIILTKQGKLVDYLKNLNLKNKNLLLMSIGNFSGLDLNLFAKDLMNTNQ